MKKLLLCFLALIVVAPAWGGSAVLASWAGVAIEFKGPAESVSALVAKLEKDPVHKAAACGPARTAEGATKIDCDKADTGLMAFLGQNELATVQWSISSVAAGPKPCPGTPGCVVMRCPPPSGPNMCCHSTAPYAPC